MSKFEEGGYTKDTVFRSLVNYGIFNKGDLCQVVKDDCSASPFFVHKGKQHEFDEYDEHTWSYLYLPNVDYYDAEVEVYTEDTSKTSSDSITDVSDNTATNVSTEGENVPNDITGASVKVNIVVQVRGGTTHLTRDEAWKLYQDLHKIFNGVIV
jgi:hypothetical protein